MREKKEVKKTNLHREKDLVLSLKLGENSEEIRLEQAGDMGAYEVVKAERLRAEPLELLSHHETFLPHLFLAPPYGETRA